MSCGQRRQVEARRGRLASRLTASGQTRSRSWPTARCASIAAVYSAYGWRVYNSSGSLSYLLGGRWSGGGNSAIPLGSRTLAQYQSNGAEFTHVNVLGSETQNTDYAGNGGQQAILYYPWGQVWQNPSGAYGNSLYQIFGSLQLYDTSTDGYVPPFRYYIPEQGRWLTPDPLAGGVTNPQSLNRYGYVMNNPLSLVDPSGLCPDCPPGQGQALATFSCGHGFTVPSGQNPATWCYNHMGIGSGSMIGAFFSQTADEFDLIGFVLGGQGGTYNWVNTSNGEIQTWAYSPDQLANQLNALLVLPASGVSLPPGPANESPLQPSQQSACAVPSGKHLSMGVSASIATVNPLTSGGGGVWGANRQSFPATTYNYTYSGAGAGLDVGASIQSVWAWGSGSWTGPFHSINVSVGPLSGSIFWTPGKSGWVGGSFGLGVGLPIPQAAYEVTNYTCRSGPR